MGDKSPKAVHKQTAQKQAKSDAAKQRKQQDSSSGSGSSGADARQSTTAKK